MLKRARQSKMPMHLTQMIAMLAMLLRATRLHEQPGPLAQVLVSATCRVQSNAVNKFSWTFLLQIRRIVYCTIYANAEVVQARISIRTLQLLIFTIYQTTNTSFEVTGAQSKVNMKYNIIFIYFSIHVAQN